VDAALDYSARGILVAPVHWPIPVTTPDQDQHSDGGQDAPEQPTLVCSCKHGAACPLPAQHLITGCLSDATTNARRIIEWWTGMPEANIATPAGLSFDVLECTHPGSIAPLLAWLSAYGLKPGPILTDGDGQLRFPVRNPHPGGPRAHHGQHLRHLRCLDYGTPVLLPPSRLINDRKVVWLRPFDDSIVLLPDGDRLFNVLARLPDADELDRRYASQVAQRQPTGGIPLSGAW
jgi:hypothetical protein